MNGDFRKTSAAVPIPFTSQTKSTRSIIPPKRFLDFPSQASPSRRPTALVSSSLKTSPVKFELTVQESSAPSNLVSIPTLIVTPVPLDADQKSIGRVNFTSSVSSSRMPITTRKEKHALTTPASVEKEETSNKRDEKISPEIPKKRTRGGDKGVGETSAANNATSSTPRKIIQEIFGPDKSKRPKGKGRKRKRGPLPTKRKVFDLENIETVDEQIEDEEDAHEQDEETQVEPEINVDVNQTNEEKAENTLEEIEQNACEPEKVTVLDQEENVIEEISTEALSSKSNSTDLSLKKAEKSEENQSCEQVVSNDTIKVEEEEDGKDYIKCEASKNCKYNNNRIVFSCRSSKRKAKQLAKEKLKRLSQSDETTETDGTKESEEMCSEVLTCEVKDNEEPAEIRSRRSTTDGSSKSGSSTVPADSESSMGCNFSNKHLLVDRQRLNPTPLSVMSEDDFNDDKEHLDGTSDLLEQKDSDVDSTYSWKPVRAAAAAALEQVTKKQGTGTSGVSGDTDSKSAAAAADRRARKVMRHKGRSRRTLQFKSSSSKQHMKGRSNRYSAQPTVAQVVHDHGSYFQTGDIINIELTDGALMYGQIKGILMDHKGEISAGIRWLSPKHPLFDEMMFHPRNYAIRTDIPERLIKIEYVNFVMHSNLDYFNGHPSYGLFEKHVVYTRLGRLLYKDQYTSEFEEDDSSSYGENKNGSSSSTSVNSDTNNCEDDMADEDKLDDGDNSSSSGSDEEIVTEEKICNKREVEIKAGENVPVDLMCEEVLDDEEAESFEENN